MDADRLRSLKLKLKRLSRGRVAPHVTQEQVPHPRRMGRAHPPALRFSLIGLPAGCVSQRLQICERLQAYNQEELQQPN